MSFLLSLDAAVSSGALLIEDGASVSEDLRVIRCEDNGTTRGPSIIKAGAIIRSGVTICSGVEIGLSTMVGHNCVLRAGVKIGDHTVISHMVSIERDVRIGNGVRVSAQTHLTGECVLEDDVHMGAGVKTINDRDLLRVTTLMPPVFKRGSRIGSGSTVLAGIEIGEGAVVGAGSVVTRNVPAYMVVYGVPAYIQRGVHEKGET